jgi:hypothetical protein
MGCIHDNDRPVVVANDGTTTCCGAYTTIFIDDGTEYCKCCQNDVDGYDMTLPTAKPGNN